MVILVIDFQWFTDGLMIIVFLDLKKILLPQTTPPSEVVGTEVEKTIN